MNFLSTIPDSPSPLSSPARGEEIETKRVVALAVPSQLPFSERELKPVGCGQPTLRPLAEAIPSPLAGEGRVRGVVSAGAMAPAVVPPTFEAPATLFLSRRGWSLVKHPHGGWSPRASDPNHS